MKCTRMYVVSEAYFYAELPPFRPFCDNFSLKNFWQIEYIAQLAAREGSFHFAAGFLAFLPSLYLSISEHSRWCQRKFLCIIQCLAENGATRSGFLCNFT
jgi:hypothetical protein